MEVSRIIVHQIIKEQGVNESELFLSDDFLDNDELSEKLVDDLNKRYTKKNINRAVFSNKIEVFSEEFKRFNSLKTDQAFKQFAENAIKSLNEAIKRVNFATGGYIVFTEYSVNQSNKFVGVFFVRNTDALIFIKDAITGKLKIDEQVQIDFEKMAVACRIHSGIYDANDGRRYLNFITGRNDSVSDYFRDWLNGSNFEDEIKDTLYLINIINNVVPLPFNEEGNEMTRDEFRQSVYDFVNVSPNKEVNIEILDEYFYGDDTNLKDYIEENGIPISSTFKARPNILRKLHRVSLKADRISLTFPHELITKRRIIIDEESDERIILYSRNLVEQLQREVTEAGT